MSKSDPALPGDPSTKPLTTEERRQREDALAFERKWRNYNTIEGWGWLRVAPAVLLLLVFLYMVYY